jgi:hypothetical protein
MLKANNLTQTQPDDYANVHNPTDYSLLTQEIKSH